MKKGFWRLDWFVDHIISLAFLFATNSMFLPSLERNAYDSGIYPSTRETDDKSL